MSVLVSACSLIGVLVLPLLNKNNEFHSIYKYFYALMIALGTSALFCDAILHLIPAVHCQLLFIVLLVVTHHHTLPHVVNVATNKGTNFMIILQSCSILWNKFLPCFSNILNKTFFASCIKDISNLFPLNQAISYSGKFSREKTFTDQYYRKGGKNFKFIGGYKISKFVKVFSLENFPLYGIISVIDKLWLPRIYRSYTTLSSRA